MKKQIDELVSLIAELKSSARKVFNPSCSHKDITKDVQIYFADGYTTFQFTACKIEVTEYIGAITMPFNTTEEDISNAIEKTKQAIAHINKMPKINAEKAKQERISRLKQEIEELSKG